MNNERALAWARIKEAAEKKVESVEFVKPEPIVEPVVLATPTVKPVNKPLGGKNHGRSK
jgi:hypothetical protein